PAVAQGRATPQDQASQAVVEILDPQRGERVLDVAAAPGGKATAAAERVGAAGSVIALDLNGGRLALVRTAATRLGLSNLAIARADATALPVQASSFDRVLVDAPCSGLGVLRRRPEARWRVQPEAIAPLAQLQADLVIEAARAVRPGGRIVYSVCTVTAEETIGVAERALGELRGFDVIP